MIAHGRQLRRGCLTSRERFLRFGFVAAVTVAFDPGLRGFVATGLRVIGVDGDAGNEVVIVCPLREQICHRNDDGRIICPDIDHCVPTTIVR
jgi:hypothetical protein